MRRSTALDRTPGAANRPSSNPSCISGTSPVNGSTAANTTKWRGAGGLRRSMINNLFAARSFSRHSCGQFRRQVMQRQRKRHEVVMPVRRVRCGCLIHSKPDAQELRAIYSAARAADDLRRRRCVVLLWLTPEAPSRPWFAPTPVCRRRAPSGSPCSVRAESVMGAARIPLAAVQRRILLVAAVEDKRSAFAETRLMSGGPRLCKVPSRFAVWRRSARRGRWLP